MEQLGALMFFAIDPWPEMILDEEAFYQSYGPPDRGFLAIMSMLATICLVMVVVDAVAA